MKIFRSESFVDYKTYTFNYATYCIKEDNSELPEIYDLGFLPYSNNVQLREETYYLARSLRVNLSAFSPSSENRRILRKIEPLAPEIEVIPIEQFDIGNSEFKAYCLNFANKRFSEPISEARLDYIFQFKSISHVFRCSLEHKVVGYVICIMEQGSLHYWFSFFDLDRQAYALGKWMMFSVINWAHKEQMSYVYLGTCYGEKSLYKVRDFKGLSYFDGNRWDDDVKTLKRKCKTDKEFSTDEFKQDTELFLQRLSF